MLCNESEHSLVRSSDLRKGHPVQSMLPPRHLGLIHAKTAETTRLQHLAPGPSIFLDVVRFLAAVMVAVGHLSLNCFTIGWPPVLMSWAEGAVAVFFVLSGFMIRYVTIAKYGDLRRFAIDRIARIYSVVLPAMALTVLFDLTSARVNPGYYNENFGGLVGRVPAIFSSGPPSSRTCGYSAPFASCSV